MGLLISKGDAPCPTIALATRYVQTQPLGELVFPSTFYRHYSIHLFIIICLYLSICLSIYLSIFIYMQVHGHDVRSERPIYLNSIFFFSYIPLYSEKWPYNIKPYIPKATPRICSSRFCLSFFCCHRNVVTSTSTARGRWNLDESSAETSAPNDHVAAC